MPTKDGKEEGQPPSGPGETQEEEPSRREFSYQSILPNLPSNLSQELSQEHSQEEGSPRHAPQAPRSPYGQRRGSAPTDSNQLGATVEPRPTYPALPPSTREGHPPYSVPTPATGPYSALPPPVGSSAAGPPPQGYAGYGPYPTSAPYYPGSQGYFGTTPYTPGPQSGYPPSPQATAGSYPGMGSHPYAQASSYYRSGYPQQQYPGQGGYYYGQPGRQGGYPTQTNRSWARDPGRPYQRDSDRAGPEGANLFVFHIPNNMTNQQLLELFSQYGEVRSARIMTEGDTGRGRGFGFVSFDTPLQAATAIQHLHGYQIGGKRLKVQHKQVQPRSSGRGQRNYSPSPTDFAQGQQYAQGQHYHFQGQQYAQGQQYDRRQRPRHQGNQNPSPVGFIPLHAPVQEYRGAQGVHVPDSASPSETPTHERAGPPEIPVQEQRRPPDIDAQETGASESGSPEPHPLRPPYETPAAEGSHDSGENQDEERNAASASPLADLKDIGEALPDT